MTLRALVVRDAGVATQFPRIQQVLAEHAEIVGPADRTPLEGVRCGDPGELQQGRRDVHEPDGPIVVDRAGHPAGRRENQRHMQHFPMKRVPVFVAAVLGELLAVIGGDDDVGAVAQAVPLDGRQDLLHERVRSADRPVVETDQRGQLCARRAVLVERPAIREPFRDAAPEGFVDERIAHPVVVPVRNVRAEEVKIREERPVAVLFLEADVIFGDVLFAHDGRGIRRNPALYPRRRFEVAGC